MSRATKAPKKDGEKAKEPDCVCDLCDGPLKVMEETLHCKGSCGKHLHRYCASVSEYHYLELKNSSSPFVCPQGLHRAEVQDLQSVVAALKDELNELCTGLLCLLKQAAPVVASLSTEDIVQELKKDVEKLQSTFK